MQKKPKTVIIMHISDLHFGIEQNTSPKYRREREKTIEAFYRDLSTIPDNWRPQIIAITGDLGWSGAVRDYDEFQNFIHKLLKQTNIPLEKVICCPGNHDKELAQEAIVPESINEKSDFHSVQSIWPVLDGLSEYFNNYSQALRNIGIIPLANGSNLANTEYLYGYRYVDGIYFMVLNSAWLCDWRKDENGNADQGSLLIDGDVVCDVLDHIGPNNSPVIAMFHHPKDWLKISEYRDPDAPHGTTFDCIDGNSNIVLYGHTHAPDNTHTRYRLDYSAGAFSSNDTYFSQCWLIKLHIDETDARLSMVDEAKFFSAWSKNKLHKVEAKWCFKVTDKSVQIDTYAHAKEEVRNRLNSVIMMDSQSIKGIERIEELQLKLEELLLQLEKKHMLNEVLFQLKNIDFEIQYIKCIEDQSMENEQKFLYLWHLIFERVIKVLENSNDKTLEKTFSMLTEVEGGYVEEAGIR